MAPNNDTHPAEILATALANCELNSSDLKSSQPSLKNLKDFGKPPPEHNVLLQALGAPHVGSFNYMLEKRLNYAVDDLDAMEFKLPPECGEQLIKLKVEEARLLPSEVPPGAVGVLDTRIFPSETRQRGMKNYHFFTKFTRLFNFCQF